MFCGWILPFFRGQILSVFCKIYSTFWKCQIPMLFGERNPHFRWWHLHVLYHVVVAMVIPQVSPGCLGQIPIWGSWKPGMARRSPLKDVWCMTRLLEGGGSEFQNHPPNAVPPIAWPICRLANRKSCSSAYAACHRVRCRREITPKDRRIGDKVGEDMRTYPVDFIEFRFSMVKSSRT